MAEEIKKDNPFMNAGKSNPGAQANPFSMLLSNVNGLPQGFNPFGAMTSGGNQGNIFDRINSGESKSSNILIKDHEEVKESQNQSEEITDRQESVQQPPKETVNVPPSPGKAPKHNPEQIFRTLLKQQKKEKQHQQQERQKESQANRAISKAEMIEELTKYFRKNKEGVELDPQKVGIKVKQKEVEKLRDHLERKMKQVQEIKNKKSVLQAQVKHLEQRLKQGNQEYQQFHQQKSQRSNASALQLQNSLTKDSINTGILNQFKSMLSKLTQSGSNQTYSSQISGVLNQINRYQQLGRDNSLLEQSIATKKVQNQLKHNQFEDELKLSQGPNYKRPPTAQFQNYIDKCIKIDEQIKVQKEQYLKRKRESGISISHSALTEVSQKTGIKVKVNQDPPSKNYLLSYLIVGVFAVIVGIYLAWDH